MAVGEPKDVTSPPSSSILSGVRRHLRTEQVCPLPRHHRPEDGHRGRVRSPTRRGCRFGTSGATARTVDGPADRGATRQAPSQQTSTARGCDGSSRRLGLEGVELSRRELVETGATEDWLDGLLNEALLLLDGVLGKLGFDCLQPAVEKLGYAASVTGRHEEALSVGGELASEGPG
jgi:hypothetical protein